MSLVSYAARNYIFISPKTQKLHQQPISNNDINSNIPIRTLLKLRWERSNAMAGSRVWPTSKNGTATFCSAISNCQKDSTRSRDEDLNSKCIWNHPTVSAASRQSCHMITLSRHCLLLSLTKSINDLDLTSIFRYFLHFLSTTLSVICKLSKLMIISLAFM